MKKGMNSRIVLEYGDRRYALQASWIRRPHHLPVMPVADLTCTADGCLYILTRNHEHPIMAFDPEGNYMETLGADLDFGNEHGLHVSPDDCLWVCDSGRHLVYKLTRKGEVVLRLGTPDTPCDNGFRPEIHDDRHAAAVLCVYDAVRRFAFQITELPKLLALILSFIIIVSNPMSSLASTELDNEVSAPEVRVTSPDSDIVFDQIEDAVIPEEITEQPDRHAYDQGIAIPYEIVELPDNDDISYEDSSDVDSARGNERFVLILRTQSQILYIYQKKERF